MVGGGSTAKSLSQSPLVTSQRLSHYHITTITSNITSLPISQSPLAAGTSPLSHSKEISQQRDLKAKRFHSTEISQQRSLTAKTSHSKELSQQGSFAAKTSNSRKLTQQRNPTEIDISQQRDLTAKKITAKRSHSKEI